MCFPLVLATVTNLFFSPIEETKLTDTSQIESQQGVTTVLLIRHGESAFNVRDANGVKYTSGKGHTVPLTDSGKQQAEELGNKLIGRLSSKQSYVILSSTAIRAQLTSDLIFSKLQSHYNIERGIDFENLIERGQGIWEGLPKDDKYDQQVKRWEGLSARNKFYTPMLETGESHSEVAIRAIKSLESLLELYPNKTIIITTHFIAMNALALHWDGVEHLSDAPSTNLPSLRFDNCDILKIEIPQGSSVEHAIIKTHYKA